MERELRTFGEGAEQNQTKRRRIAWIGNDHLVPADQHRDIVGAADLAQQDRTGDQSQPTTTGDSQRHPGRTP